MIQLLKALMQFESDSIENINKTIDFTADYLQKKGISGTIIENEGLRSYVALIGKGKKTLILNGHLDVVSGKKEQFTPVETEDRIIGRGSADMKGGCAAMIEAFIDLSQEELTCQVMLQLVPDEETGGRYGTAYLLEKGYTGDFVICTEPTDLQVSLKAKGIINLYLESTGVAAHGSRPWEGKNAIIQAFEDFRRIEALPILQETSPYYEKSSVNLGRIEGGDILNRVPDRCQMGLDIRYVPHLDPKDIIAAIENVVKSQVIVERTEPAVDTQEDHPYVQSLQKVLVKETGKESVFLAAHGGSDGRFFANQGIPTVEIGPKGEFWHGDGEYVEKESLFQLKRILIDFTKSFQ
jgi:succinyl-diaminopimelate desuccinylase